MLAGLALALGAAPVSARAAAEAATFDGIDAAELRQVIDRAYDLDPGVGDELAALQRAHPASLAPAFVRVVREYWLQNYAETDATATAAFERDAQALIERSRARFRERPDDPDVACLTGMSQLIAGLYQVEKRHWWTAFWKIRAGRAILADILDDHPDYADAKMGTGLADCYLDRTPVYLKPLTLLFAGGGDFDRGLARLRAARDHGVITAVESAYYLAAVQAELGHDLAAARDELAPLAERFPDNPFFQRILGYFELHSDRRAAGRARLEHIVSLPAVSLYPALLVRSQMWLCWDCMGTKDYAEALAAADRAAAATAGHPELAPLQPEILTGQGEALKALGRIDEAFAHFEAVSPDFPDARRHALERVQQIKRELAAAPR